jgi:hypothetical protein
MVLGLPWHFHQVVVEILFTGVSVHQSELAAAAREDSERLALSTLVVQEVVGLGTTALLPTAELLELLPLVLGNLPLKDLELVAAAVGAFKTVPQA